MARKKKFGAILFLLILVLTGALVFILKNPTPVTSEALKDPLHEYDFAQYLQKHIAFLTSIDPPRNIDHPKSLEVAKNYLVEVFKERLLVPELETFEARGVMVSNVKTRIGPLDKDMIVIGAHYDVAGEQPGADDNASGVAALIEIASFLKANESTLDHQFEIVAYVNEEPPMWDTPQMGSVVHAQNLKKIDAKVKLMISLEMLGYYSNQDNSQSYPLKLFNLIYPTRGNFIAIIGRIQEWSEIRRIKEVYPVFSDVPMKSINALFPVGGIELSDHRSYWREGYPAVMITDTAFFRNPHYHQTSDTIDKLDLKRMAKVVRGILSTLFFL